MVLEGGAFVDVVPGDLTPVVGASTKGPQDVDASPSPAGPPARLWPEARRVLSLAVPISVSEVVSFFAYLITTAQVGHLGSLQLSAITLARSVFHVTGLSLVVGMASAVETFCGQAYGAEHFGSLGTVLQRACMLCLLTCAVPLALWTRADWLMRLLGQQPEVIALAAPYVRLLGPSLCMWGVSGCIKSYLSSQGVVAPLTVVAVIYTALTPIVNHFFMFRPGLGLGMAGAAAAYNLLSALARERPEGKRISGGLQHVGHGLGTLFWVLTLLEEAARDQVGDGGPRGAGPEVNAASARPLRSTHHAPNP
ncbi:Multidrug and toxin extrusion protein 1 [Tetrabaena socialis]|uniref:Multidrug and toxin extrusion protein 1 n=1 Tax=Tetrabaena socialis TaxID=47790 RepID=A0A2J8AA92_9CHLO|nr:Multidrug and toxin extrusion protein 1 [Tetrabaena socialis]|eukprot:PNH09442.1 Multidrug and toxin extrusion protein 1 [Tetrabaena socialis]